MHVGSEERSSARRWLLVAIVILVAAVAAVVLVLARGGKDDRGTAAPTPSASPSAVPPAKEIAHFAGTGPTVTRTFSTDTNWQVRWAAPRGSGFHIELLTAKGVSRGVIVAGSSSKGGSVYVTERGTFKLRVAGSRPWTIDIFSRPPQS
jgi:hypothetical protein